VAEGIEHEAQIDSLRDLAQDALLQYLVDEAAAATGPAADAAQSNAA
jgi:hypothetical protein